MRTLVLTLSLLGQPSFLTAQAPSPDHAFLIEMSQAGGRADALAIFCTAQNRAELQRNSVALAQWRERNRWSNIQAFWHGDSSLEPAYNNERVAASAELKQHGFKSAFLCAALPNTLRAEKFDPSLHHRAQLAQLTPPSADQVPSTGTPGGGSDNGAANGSGIQPQPRDPSGVPASGSPGAVLPRSNAPNSDTPAPGAVEASTPASGQQLTAGEATFTVPPGWTVAKQTPDAVMLQRNKPGDGRTLILVAAQPLSGDLKQSFLSAVRSQYPGTGLTLKYPHDALTTTGLPAITVSDGGRLNDARKSYGNIDAVGIGTGGRLQTALMLSVTSVGERMDRRKDFERLVSGWRLRTPGTQPPWNPLRPTAPGTSLSGLWFGSRIMNQLNPLGGMDLIAVREYVVLLPDGRAYNELPNGGHVLDVDFTASCRQKPKACGTYTADGSIIHFQWAGDYGLVIRESSPLKRNDAGETTFTYDAAWLHQTPPVHHLRLNGQYTSTFAMAGSTAAGSNSVVSQTFIRFAPDGTFQKSGFSSASFSNSNAQGTVGGNRGLESGRYSIDGYTLTLEPTGGAAAEQYTVVFEDPSPTTKAVFINDKAFLR